MKEVVDLLFKLLLLYILYIYGFVLCEKFRYLIVKNIFYFERVYEYLELILDFFDVFLCV